MSFDHFKIKCLWFFPRASLGEKMSEKYSPLYEVLFKRYDYTWEDLDKDIYKKILLEEGYPQDIVDKELDYLDKNFFFSEKW